MKHIVVKSRLGNFKEVATRPTLAKCLICSEDTEVHFNIAFKATPVCSSCAESIFIQQANAFFNERKAPDKVSSVAPAKTVCTSAGSKVTFTSDNDYTTGETIAGSSGRADKGGLRDPSKANVARLVRKACKAPTLVEAMAFIAQCEAKRIVEQTAEDFAAGKLGEMDTFFKCCFEMVMKRYPKKPRRK